jgi:thiol-disulfide isomerase/thioredoxin
MKRILLAAALAAVFCGSATGQSMMKSSSGASGGVGSMTAPATPAAPAAATSSLVIFTDLAAARALAKKGPVVLFFAAAWSPTCQAALDDINANGSRLKDIAVVVVDYDKARELKSKYRVTVQHTFVQIDADGGKLAAWNGGGVDMIVKSVVRGKGG